MKVRLQLTSAGQTTTLEHPGPVVHIGRDPSCELALEGESASGVSRRHARIELDPGGATLADAGSSNGTLLNDQPITSTVPLRPGDRIRLGFTGPTLTVLDLDLQPTPTTQPAASSALALVSAGVAAALLLVLLAVVWIRNRPRSPVEPTSPAVALATNPEPPATARVDPVVETHPEPTQRATHRETPAPATHREPPPPPPPPPPAAANFAEVPVGRYEAPPDWGPSVLLVRRGEAYPWVPSRSGDKIVTARTLLSLPGYRSEILLDSKVQLTLWGNVPEFDGLTPLLLESSAMLRAPESGVDLDLTLEWGRVKVANLKESGAAQIRLRFRREVWDLTLPDRNSEVAVELWAALPPLVPGAQQPAAPVSLGLFTRGPVTFRATGTHADRFDLPDHARVAWTNAREAPLYRTTMPELPGWWTKPPDASKPLIADAMLSLKDWAAQLNGAADMVETIQNVVAKSNDSGLREQGMFFLEPLNGAPYLVNYLEDPRHARVRRAAAHSLRAWLTREPGRTAELTNLLRVKVNSPSKAKLILELLYSYSPEALKKPETYQQLIGYLDDDNLAVRELALWHLEELVPSVAGKVTYDPTGPAEQRHQAVQEWQKQLPAGSLPPQ